MKYNYRFRICIMATIDIIVSVLGLTWLTYMYNFVIYDYTIKHYLGADSECFNKLKNIETKDINQQYFASLTLFGISMIGFTFLAVLLMILAIQEPTRRLPLIMNFVAQILLLIIELAACIVFNGGNLCSLNSIPNRFDHTQRWPLQWIILIITLLFIFCYKPYELWCVLSMILQLSKKQNSSDRFSIDTQRSDDLPPVFESDILNDYFTTETPDRRKNQGVDYSNPIDEQRNAKRPFKHQNNPRERDRNDQHNNSDEHRRDDIKNNIIQNLFRESISRVHV